MIKAAIEKIQQMSLPVVTNVDGRAFCFHDGTYEEVVPEVIAPATFPVRSLDGMVKMVKTEGLKKWPTPLYITVKSHVEVLCHTQTDNEEAQFNRNCLYSAMATDVPGWNASEQMSFEEAMIALRTRFQNTDDSVYALKLLSDISTGSKVTYNDNGVATSVVTRKGIDLQTNAAIRPIVTLKPYRTFQEVEQPASEFLIRINERGILFTEADGGMWKLAARRTIKAYFDEAFEDEIERGDVVVML